MPLKKLTIAHLSDLHLSESTILDQTVILDALILDLKEQVRDGRKFDLVFFTGDLIAKGQYSDQSNQLAKEKFIFPVLDVLGLSSDRLIMIPGNHDLQLSKLNNCLQPVFDGLSDTNKVNKLIDSIDKTPYLWEGFESFYSLLEEIGEPDTIFKNALFRSYKIKIANISIGVCGINSAWRAKGSVDDGDCGRLIIGQRQIDLLSEKTKDCDIKLALMHHPLSWLTPFDQHSIQPQIRKEFDGVFFGHNHNADSYKLGYGEGNLLFSNAGCLYQSRNYFNGYTVLEYTLDEKKWNVFAREYYSSRGVFDISPRFAKNGESEFISISHNEEKNLSSLPTEEFISNVYESVDSHLLSLTISDTAPKKLKAIFVAPPISHMSERRFSALEHKNDEGTYLSLPEVVNSNKAVFFVGRKEAGKTTLLHYICAESHNSGFFEKIKFGSYVDLNTIKETNSGILNALMGFSNGAYRKKEFIQLLSQGKMVLCFDNFLASNKKSTRLLEEFTIKYPENKYFFSVQEDVESSFSETAIPKLNMDAEIIYIHSFGRKQTRLLIDKWFGKQAEVGSENVDNLLLLLDRLNVPRTPFIISILLWVKEKNISFNPVNHAEIIDTLVDGMLEKFQELKTRSSLDSNIKRHFLTELAYEMECSGSPQLLHNKLDSFTANYFQKKHLPSASGPFIEELKIRGILHEVGDDVCFKFDCLRLLFISTKMRDSQDFLSQVLTKDGFLKFGKELDYFTGRYRDQAIVIHRSLEIVNDLYLACNLNVDLNIFDDISVNESFLTPDRLASIENKILDNPLLDKEREDLLDTIDLHSNMPTPFNESKSTDENHLDEESKKITEFMDGLITASAILRNSELVDEAELKQDAYRQLMRYWGKVMLKELESISITIENNKN